MLRSAFEKGNNYKHTCITRLFLSQLVYARYYMRPLWEDFKIFDNYCTTVDKFVKEYKPLFVVLSAEPSVLYNRILTRGENPNKGPKPEEVVRLYDMFIGMLRLEEYVLRLDTTDNPGLEHLVTQIENRVALMQKGD